MVGAAGLSLDAAPAAQETKHEEQKPAPADAKAKSHAEQTEPLHYSGKVTEIGTDKPIAGALVMVRRSVLDRNRESTVLLETKHTTGEDGVYSFTITPEKAAQGDLRIEIDVEHPEYATRTGFRSTLSMIRRNEKMGGRPSFESFRLWPSKPIVGHVERPDGSPAKGVSVLAYSRSGALKPGDTAVEFLATPGSFSRAKTDQAGKFKVNVTTPGLAVFWILPEDLAGELHGVPIVRGPNGHVGRFTLRQGVSLKGRVLDVQGKPIAGVFVNAERQNDPEAREILTELHVGDAIARTAITGADGSFALAPLPSGEYRVSPADSSREGSEGRKMRPLLAAFTARKVSLKEGETPIL